MQYLPVVGVLVVVLATGFLKIRAKVNSLTADFDLVNEFHQKFLELASLYRQKIFNERIYHWLVSRMDKIQSMLGTFGKAYFISAYNRFEDPNYHYIINTIPDIRTGRTANPELLTCDDMLVRYLGSLSRRIEAERVQLKKPFVLLQLGLQFYLGMPVRLLYWFGIISDSSFNKITASKVFIVLSGIGGLVAFISALIQILQAWPFVQSLF